MRSDPLEYPRQNVALDDIASSLLIHIVRKLLQDPILALLNIKGKAPSAMILCESEKSKEELRTDHDTAD